MSLTEKDIETIVELRNEKNELLEILEDFHHWNEKKSKIHFKFGGYNTTGSYEQSKFYYPDEITSKRISDIYLNSCKSRIGEINGELVKF